MFRCRTRVLRSTSACAIDVGFSSIEWQMFARFQTSTAEEFVCNISQSLNTSGTLATKMRRLGKPDASVSIAVWNWER